MAIATAALFISLATLLLRSAGLSTGGVVGVAFLLHYGMDWSFGLLFFVLNVPFYWLGFKERGWSFIGKTVMAVGLTAALAEAIPHWALLRAGHPAYAAVAGGALAGVGTLALFRHNSSFGGFGVVALYMQRTRGWRAGNILLAIDLVILLAAITLLSPEEVLWSTLCAVVLNMTVALNHRSDRYLVQ